MYEGKERQNWIHTSHLLFYSVASQLGKKAGKIEQYNPFTSKASINENDLLKRLEEVESHNEFVRRERIKAGLE